MIKIPEEILQKFEYNFKPKERWFYKFIKSKWISEKKDKYKFFIKYIQIIDLYHFITSTSKEYIEDYEEYFRYEIENDIKVNSKDNWPKNIWYIYFWKNTEINDFYNQKELNDKKTKNEIIFIWYLRNEKHKELNKFIKNSKNFSSNFENSISKFTKDTELEDQVFKKIFQKKELKKF